jgi:hypothetical protein
MSTSGNEQYELSVELRKKTEEGRLQDWVERIGQVAKMAGLPLYSIVWNVSAADASSAVVRSAINRDKLSQLRTAIKEYVNPNAQ